MRVCQNRKNWIYMYLLCYTLYKKNSEIVADKQKRLLYTVVELYTHKNYNPIMLGVHWEKKGKLLPLTVILEIIHAFSILVFMYMF